MMNRIAGLIEQQPSSTRLLPWDVTSTNDKPSTLNSLNQKTSRLLGRHPMATIAAGLFVGVLIGCMTKRR